MFANTVVPVKSELLMGVISLTYGFRRRETQVGIPLKSMAKLKFDLPAPLDSATAFDKIKNLLSGDNDFKKFDPKATASFDEASKKCVIKGSQFTAEMNIQSKGSSSSNVNIVVELPLAAMLFKGKIQEMLEKNLKKIL
jgi:hypothetical protein